MKKVLLLFIFIKSSSLFACGGGFYWEGMEFYNLFRQTNIAAEEYYPFLRDEYNQFYNDYEENSISHRGNVKCWQEILKDWELDEIHRALYNGVVDWSMKSTPLEQAAKTYIEFAKKCAKAFYHRANNTTWDYNQIINQTQIEPNELLEEANALMLQESNSQLRARYYYQIVRTLHYTQNWEEAIRLFESKIENQFDKNEIYYYILDQVAGCYYSLEQYDKAAYLFTKVLNNSYDRKTSAFLSFNFCAQQGADGKAFFEGIEDEKDLLLIKSLINFSDEISNINQFIALDANDSRVELLFMRALNEVEREVWPARIGVADKTLPSHSENYSFDKLLAIVNKQLENKKVEHHDFWQMASSYLSFVNGDILLAENKLEEVDSFIEQKKKLGLIYKVFSWDTILAEQEDFILQTFTQKELRYDKWDMGSAYDFRNVVLDKIANTYYKNKEIAKAFLVHNDMANATHLHSLELLNDLEKLYNKPNKSKYEEILIAQATSTIDLLDYVNYQKGIYYLYQNDPINALESFKKDKSNLGQMQIPDTLFSNNTIECFNCNSAEVMVDEVYKAELFSFIKPSFSRTELASYLIELQKMTLSETKWKAKLAYYLLGNYYYNISNSGYYRGLLTDNSNIGHYFFFNIYGSDRPGEEIIAKGSGYNLSDINEYGKHHFGLSNISSQYYEKVIDLSNDKELNARCLFLIAKNGLNSFYNGEIHETYDMQVDNYYKMKLPKQNSFERLKEDYSNTKFHQMIIDECSYYRYYASSF